MFNKETIDDIDFDLLLKHYKFLNKIKRSELSECYFNNLDKINNIYSLKLFLLKYPNIIFEEYKKINSINHNNIFKIINDYDKCLNKYMIITSIKEFQDKFSFLDITDNDMIYRWSCENQFIKNPDFNINIYKTFYPNKIYSVKTFYEVYPNITEKYSIDDLINMITHSLKKGISLIIRAKNEELNVKMCIESVIDLVDEIIFVDNGSTDNTYDIVKSINDKKIKLYKYNIAVAKAGLEHKEAIKNNNKNTLGTFYNWCLSKATFNNVFKWDADFICIRNNFKQLVSMYNLRERTDKFAIWFTGKTLFEDDGNYYLNNRSFYNEYRIFSYKNNFKWYDGDMCEYTEPYLESCSKHLKMKYIYPLFYEIKRTSIDEFKERSSLLDKRDYDDHNILTNKVFEGLIPINLNMINTSKNILIYTPSLSFGGGNQFVANMYEVFKLFGYQVNIIPLNNENLGNNKYCSIIRDDIKRDSDLDFNADFIIFNSVIPPNITETYLKKTKSKLIFITHSDVAYSNYYIEKYHQYFHKIITVNNYTINKLSKIKDIDPTKFFKVINYTDIGKRDLRCSKKFGVISRFSEDKNIPMFLKSLIDVFKRYPDYQCYLVGCGTIEYDNYLKGLIKDYELDRYVIFQGYQNDTLKYYNMFEFIVLPSVSEGCSYNIIEAMSLGIPVIASDVGGNHELIQNNINGILYPYIGIKEYEGEHLYIENYNGQLAIINDEKYRDINEKSITESIIRMIDMNHTDMINRNIDFIKTNFNENIYIKQILEII